jgi:hypothetical protein
MSISQDGRKLAIGAGNGAGILEVHEFDANSGLVTSYLDLSSSLNGSGFGGVCFSPNAEFLYASFLAIYQYDLSAGGGSSQDVSSSQFQLNYQFGTLSYRSLALGPNDKIYLSRGSEYLAVINNPNELGLACNYADSAIDLSPGTSEYGLPNFMSSYGYTASGICDTTASITETIQSQTTALTVYPNPFTAQTQLTYQTPQGVEATLRLTDVRGRVVQSVQLPSNTGTYNLQATELGTGIYFCSLVNGAEVLATQKLSVVRQ